MKFQYFEHTADAMFESYGKTLEETFENAGLAMFNILVDIKQVKPILSFPIQIENKQLRKLLYDFLDELLFLLDTELFVASSFTEFKIEKENEIYKLSCNVNGDKAKNYETHGDIKAPTYNEMNIENKNGNPSINTSM